MGILKTVGELFAPNDPELVEKTLARIAEQDTWNDVFSTKLIELLDNIDTVKGEIRERMRRVEAVKRAESSLLEAAAETAAINLKLADTEKTLNAVHREFLEAKRRYEVAEKLRAESETLVSQSESRFSSARSLLEDASTRYQSAMELASSSANSYLASSHTLQESSRAYTEADRRSTASQSSLEAASQRLEGAEVVQHQASQSALEAKRLLTQATSRLDDARSLANEGKRHFNGAQERLESSIRNLTIARERETLAEQKQLKAARLFRLTARYAVLAVVFSWFATAWMGWIVLRSAAPFWVAGALSIQTVIMAILVTREGKDEA